jgi:hypothetical protein
MRRQVSLLYAGSDVVLVAVAVAVGVAVVDLVATTA